MMTDDELRALELLSKGGLNAKQVIIGNSGTVNYNDYSAPEQAPKQQPKQEQRQQDVAPRPLSDARQQLLHQIMDLISQGEWHLQGGAERVGQMMSRVLGADGMAMSHEERQQNSSGHCSSTDVAARPCA